MALASSRAAAGSTTRSTGELPSQRQASLLPRSLLSVHTTHSAPSPEPHILLFRRPLGTDPVTGKVDVELERDAKDAYNASLAVNQRK